MTSGKQTVHNFTTIYCGEKLYGPPKRVSFTDKNQIKTMTKSSAEVGIIGTLNDK